MENNKEILKNGKILKILIMRYARDSNAENLISIVRCLHDSSVWIPVEVKASKFDISRIFQAKKNDIITTKDNIKFSPILAHFGNEKFIPIFSSLDEFGEQLVNCSKIEMPFIQVLEMAINNPNVNSIVIDPHSSPLPFPRGLFNWLKLTLEKIDKEE